MALVKCPDCGKEVSDKAPACPGCGGPIAMKAGPFGNTGKGATVRPDFWHDPNVGCVGAFLLFLVFIALLTHGCHY